MEWTVNSNRPSCTPLTPESLVEAFKYHTGKACTMYEGVVIKIQLTFQADDFSIKRMGPRLLGIPHPEDN